jgi:formate dehydrogenase major subunit
MTNHWVDIKNANLVVVMGGNPAEAHPVGFRWAIDAKIHNNAKILVVDPRFTRSAAVADEHVALRSGTDITFLLGVIHYLITNDKIQHEYVRNYTNASFLVRDDFAFHDGLFSGYDAEKRTYDKTSWGYQLDEQGFAKRDPSLSHPRCVWNLLREHVSRYTPDVVENICGTPQDRFQVACEMIAETAAPDKTLTSLYALGWTEHTVGSQNIRAMAIIQLLLGNMGMPGGGINALRGHTNVQGITDLGIMATALPGYLALPSEKQHPDLRTFLAAVTPKLQVQGQVNYWGNYPKFFISLLKSFYGDKATPENDFGFDWLPKWDRLNDFMYTMSAMEDGKLNGCICQGVNLLGAFPDSNKSVRALSKLKYFVVIDPLDCETSSFWENHGEFNDVNPASIQTEVFRLPSSCFAEEEGSLVNSGRWLQWHWKGADVPGEGRDDSECIAGIMMAVRDLYEQEGGNAVEPLLNMSWNYVNPEAPSADVVTKELNGRALADIMDANGNILVRKGQQLSGFGQLRDDGTTACGCWIYSGSWTEAGNQMARRDNADPSGLGNTPGWAWAWPLNRRVLYNRASMDPQGNPWDPKRKLLWWNGAAWTGYDIPDFTAAPPGSPVTPFIMQTDGVGGLFAQGKMAEGPFPEHYEPIETPLGTNPLHPSVVSNPVVRIMKNDDNFGDPSKFPYVATTYRLTEHFHQLTKAAKLNAITQPEAFAEISETLAKKVGVKSGDRIKVSSSRGVIKLKAVVTKRVQMLKVNGQEVETVGLPIHWGFKGAAVKGHLTNRLTTAVGDANTQTPEYKAFLVNVEKA